jgi:Na+-transporting methylmalonyl-CoA/oxaloacetate decarboxylase gamma subunit
LLVAANWLPQTGKPSCEVIQVIHDMSDEFPQEDPRILELRQMRAKARLGGGEVRIERQHIKGKLTARERLDLLLDKSTFNEIESFITHPGDEMGIAKEKYFGDGVVTGYGQIDGRTVLGMGLVFGVILLLWGVMAALVRLTADREQRGTGFSMGSARASDLHERKRKAAIAAVTMALAQHADGQPQPFPLPPTALVSAWQAVKRAEYLRKRGQVR